MSQGSNPPVGGVHEQEPLSVERQGSTGFCSLLSRAGGIGLMMLTVFFVFLGVYQLTPPDPVPANAPLTEFSSGRAMKHLNVIAQKPHPMGSPEHAEVREYILKELAAIGLSPAVQTTTAVNHRGVPRGGAAFPAGTVRNIVARLKGTAHSKAILLAAHYDSVPTGPGASDDGAAVAAMLETSRALRASSPLRNDVIVLFTDGEEAGLLGATAFVDEHPWAKEVGLVLNFEARGTSGPSLMFETSSDNGWLIKEFAKAAPYPVATSLSHEIYKMLPNDTDFTKFRGAGLAGFNFAYINGYAYYHTALDSIENIDERSLQHHGSYMLALTRHFANVGVENSKERDVVYFNAIGSILVIYSHQWAVLSATFVVLVMLGVGIFGLRNGQLTFSGITVGLVVFLATIITTSIVITLLWWCIQALHGEYKWIRSGDTYNSNWYMLSFVLTAAAITSAVYAYFRKKWSMQDLAIGVLMWWMLAMVLTSLYLPGSGYLFTWPLLSSSVGLGVLVAFRDQRPGSVKLLAVLAFSAIPGIILLTPIIYLLFISLTLSLSGAVMVIVVLLLGLLIPYFNLMTTPSKWLLPRVAALGSIGFLMVGSLTAGFDNNHRKPNSIFYGLNADTGEAIWASIDEEPDEWTAQFLSANPEKGALTEYFPSIAKEFLGSRAQIAPLAAPSIVLLADEAHNGVRTLRMRITSPRQAPLISVYVNASAEILEAVINGKRFNRHNTLSHIEPENRWRVRYWALPKEGIVLTLQVRSSHPLEIRVVDQSYGPPGILGTSFRPRPEHMMPTPFGFGLSDSTLVSKSFAF
jgi:hypothetical protein